MALRAGSTLGPYEIVAQLGAGGMGEVYRARDPRLGRDVAIKVIAADLARDRAAMARFEREAMSVAKLSHPNILAIFEFTHDGDLAFVVMELVEGETLRARLRRGPIPARRAVAYAEQIAEGLAAAHARGIVHRDLKPENVMLTRDDRLKLLDFGLAKSMDSASAETRGASLGSTETGTVLGTVGYMAPEQVRGLPVDARADLFAFGAVLYEMLSGHRAFEGATAADTMSAILNLDPPDLDAAGLRIAPGLERVVRRCLEKPVELRFQSATDLAFALDTLSTIGSGKIVAAPTDDGGDQPGIRPGRRPGWLGWLPWALAVAALSAVVLDWTHARLPAADPRWSHFTRITEAAGVETSPSLSPDGKTVVYSARTAGRWGIFATRVGGRNVTPIVVDASHDYRAPAISPDGSLVAFHESSLKGGIFVAGATGESMHRVTDSGFDPAWSPDGKTLAFATEEVGDPTERQSESSLYEVAATGGMPRKVVDGDAVQPSWSPDGTRLVYWSNTKSQRDLYTVAASGGPRVPLTQDAAIDWCPIWAPDGRFVYFSSDRGGQMNLWRIGVDPSTGKPTGAPEPVTAGVGPSAALPSLSRDGRKLAFRSMVTGVVPTAIPFDPVTLRAGTPVLLDIATISLVPSDVSADGTLIAYGSVFDEQEDLFVGPTHGGPLRRVTDDAPRDRGPVFTPDGRSLLFYSNRDGQWAVWAIDLDGGNLRRLGTSPTGARYPLRSSNDGDLIYTAAFGAGVYRIPLSGGVPTTLPGVEREGSKFVATGWSPDATRLIGPLVDPRGRSTGVGVYDLRTHSLALVSHDEAHGVHWLNDNRHVVYFDNHGWELVVVDTSTQKRTVVDLTLPGSSIADWFAVSPDNRTIYYGATRAEADIWLVERQ